MENKDREQDQLERGMKVFFHNGEPHYSYRGHYISCKKYAFHRSLGKTREEIMFDEAESFQELVRKNDAKYMEKWPPIHIDSFDGLMNYIIKAALPNKKGFSKEKIDEIKIKLKEDLAIEQKIKLFPPIYQDVLRMYLSHQNLDIKRERAELTSLEKTISHSLPGILETKIYNPDAFIESEEIPPW